MILINDVYQTVLSLLNQEAGSGFAVPDEFNTIAQAVQIEIFERYFNMLEEKNIRIAQVSNRADYNDTAHNTREKISIFQAETTLTITTSDADFEVDSSTISDFYRTVGLFTTGFAREIEEVQHSKLPSRLGSPLVCPTTDRPIYVKKGDDTDIQHFSVYPKAVFTTGDTPTLSSGVASVVLSYIRTPRPPMWVGDTSTGEAVPNTTATNYQNFELHPSEFENLVNKIGARLGVNKRDADVTTYLETQDQITEQQNR